MYSTLCRSYRIPDGPSKGKEDFRPSKAAMREHEGEQFISYHYNTKGQYSSVQKGRKQAFKESGNGFEERFSALYVIIEVSPPPPWTCPLHPISPFFQLVTLPSYGNPPLPL